MTTTAQAGLFGFGPSSGKGVAVATANWFRHKALMVDFGVYDDARVFPPEVGGVPVPSGAYKGGYSVGGGATIHPRLTNSLGWLLYGTLGDVNAAVSALNYLGTMAKTLLTGVTQVVSTGLTSPAASAKLCVRVYKGDNVAFTGEVTVGGTATEGFDFDTGNALDAGQRIDGIADRETIVGAESYTSVTSVSLPANALSATDDIYISVGYEDAVAKNNVFEINSTNPACIPYMGFRKYIPADCEASNYTLGETYNDCKVVGLSLNLPGNDLISARIDAIGTDFTLEQDPTWGTSSGSAGWATAGGFETYVDTPISTNVLGYIRVPWDSGVNLPVIGATVGFQNIPLGERQERVFGSAFRDDVTIVSRALTFNFIVKWTNPDLYRAVITGSKTGTAWSSTPFTARVDVMAYAGSNLTGSTVPASLRIESRSILLSIVGTPVLAGADAVLLRFAGSALDDPGYDYVRMSLVNLINGYTWPT